MHRVLLGAILAVLAGAGLTVYYKYVVPSEQRRWRQDQAEDRRRWLQEIDADNAKVGFIKDTNGNLIYVGTTNNHSQSN
jgi:hypothetical protein